VPEWPCPPGCLRVVFWACPIVVVNPPLRLHSHQTVCTSPSGLAVYTPSFWTSSNTAVFCVDEETDVRRTLLLPLLSASLAFDLMVVFAIPRLHVRAPLLP